MSDTCRIERSRLLDNGQVLSVSHQLTEFEVEECYIGKTSMLALAWDICGKELDAAMTEQEKGEGE